MCEIYNDIIPEKYEDEFVSLFVIQIRRLQNFDGWAKNMIYYDWGLPLAQSRVSNLRVYLH